MGRSLLTITKIHKCQRVPVEKRNFEPDDSSEVIRYSTKQQRQCTDDDANIHGSMSASLFYYTCRCLDTCSE